MQPPPEAVDDRGCYVEERDKEDEGLLLLMDRINQLSESQMIDQTSEDKNCAHFWRRGAAAIYPYQ
uniref:Uncharacterized protein n=1 Tax=Kalanchoe fedtschenkoi TaxID=63787 RepID=A0A7N1A0E1_KALFE